MARFYGKVGFATLETTNPGVSVEVITERPYFGEITRNSRNLLNDDKINSDLSVSNSISIVADDHANEHFHAIRYVEWAGSLWKVSNVEVQRPRLLLSLGGVYDGPRPEED